MTFLRVGLATCLTSVATGQQASFEGLGFLSAAFDDDPYSRAYDVNYDGTIIVGTSGAPVLSDVTINCTAPCQIKALHRGFLWTVGGGMTELPGPAGLDDCCGSEARSAEVWALSPSGDYAAGHGRDYSSGFAAYCARWDTATGQYDSLGSLEPGESVNARMWGVSDGGVFVVGRDLLNNKSKPVLSIDGGPVQNLIAADVNGVGTALAVSNDGSIIAGFYAPANVPFQGGRWMLEGAAYVWHPIDLAPEFTFITDMSADGGTVVGKRSFAEGEQPIRHTLGGEVQVIELPAGSVLFNDVHVSDDGEVVLAEPSLLGPALWDETNGWRSIETMLQDFGVFPAGWMLDEARDLSGDGTTIVGYAIDPNGYTQAFRAVIPRDELDSDGDGLLDSWETDGLDINGDGVIDLDLPAMGADPMFRDIFVEVDVMQNVTLIPEAMEKVEFAFIAASLMNPNGEYGIEFHVDLQTADVFPFEAAWDDDFVAFGAIKSVFFGTQAERDDPNWEHIRAARAKVFRYAAIVNAFDGGALGWGETPGNDFMCAFGGVAANDLRLQASTFLHELGHNLGLGHGGAYEEGGKIVSDDVNYKPNYVSAMNYGFDHYVNEDGDPLVLSFSSEAMPPLFEDNLDETIGIVSNDTPYVLTFHGWREPGEQPQIAWVQLNTPNYDWNHDGEQEVGVAVDLNWLGGSYPDGESPTPGQVLHGRNDWEFVQLPIGEGGAFDDGQHIPPSVEEMTEDELIYIRENLPPAPICTADVNGDGALNILDFVAFQGLFVNQDPVADCDDNGSFNILDFVCFQGLFAAGCP